MTANVSCLVKVNLLICEGSKTNRKRRRKNDFRRQIKYYRKQAGLSQEKMAEKIGVSRQAITKWENGTGTPDIANLMAIANLFQISVDELLSNEKSEKKQSNYIYESRTEYDIDGKKNFDIKLGGAYAVDLKAYHGEKIEVAMFFKCL